MTPTVLFYVHQNCHISLGGRRPCWQAASLGDSWVARLASSTQLPSWVSNHTKELEQITPMECSHQFFFGFWDNVKAIMKVTSFERHNLHQSTKYVQGSYQPRHSLPRTLILMKLKECLENVMHVICLAEDR